MNYSNMNTSGMQGQSTAGFQGQRTGAAGKGPDMICKSQSQQLSPSGVNIRQEADSSLKITVLDKLEHKFGGRRFNDPANDAKNRALNQKLARRIMTIAPKVL